MGSSVRATLALVAVLAVAAAPVAAARGPALVIHGVARLSSGDPVPKARVTATTGKRTTTTADDVGRFTLELRLPDRETLARDSTAVQIWVEARSLHFSAPDGQSSLGLVLKLEHGADGVTRVVATSNDERLAERAVRAVVSGSSVALDSVLFAGDLGESANEPFPPQRLLRVAMPVTAAAGVPGDAKQAAMPVTAGAGAPGDAKHGAAAGAAVAAGTGAGAATGHPSPSSLAPRSEPMPAAAADSFRYSRTPEDAMSHPTTAVGAGATADTSHCVCQISGTIETAGGPLREPLRLIVSLEGLAAPSDTVTLDMGSPRAFDLRGVRCGPRRLLVRAASGKLRFNVLDPEHTLSVTCERGRRAQPRVVLAPR